MAEPLGHKPRPAKVTPDARDELERLLQTAHEHGVLRFANDLIATNNQWAQIVVDGLNSDGARNAVQNLAVLVMVLSSIEPSRMYRIAFALKDAAERMDRETAGESDAPGLTGTYRMLHDKSLWSAITPLLEALKVFAEGLNRDIDEPIFDFENRSAKAQD